MSLSSDQLIVEDDIERVLNEKTKTLEIRVLEVKELLSKLITIEQSIVKIQTMLQNNNEIKKQD